ncbi:MAG: DNA polymerase III subunit gamma/tau [Thermoanaerobaculia bacterium]|nr:DNA polymerase III subunit gamma/tau [Thermoanaerobaculia bacterium]
MAYQALARKWRPQAFRDIIGQQAVVRTLQNAIEQNRIHHAYLFCGVRGVGKTTTARIFAKALNCANGPAKEPCNECTICREITEGIDLDVREIDAATYSKAEDVRDLRELMQFQPARDRRRVFIIDEVHSLSGQAWNALLKQIEEPPPHVIFMMATTEMHKIPATILSRVQQLVLRKITLDEIATRLEEICAAEGIGADRDALAMIARRGEGSVRDSLSLLDQVIAFSPESLTLADVGSILGLADSRLFSQLVASIAAGDSPRVLSLVEEASASGRDFKLLYRDLLAYLRNLMLLVAGADPSILKADPDELVSLEELRPSFSQNDLLRVINVLLRDEEIVVRSESQRLAVEIALLKASAFPRLLAVEDALASGGTTAPRAAAPAQPRPVAPVARKASAESRAATPAVDEAGTGEAPGGSIDRFVSRVESHRRVAASYLRQARRSAVEGDALIFEFGPDEAFASEYLAEAGNLAPLETIATEVFGRKMSVHPLTKAAPAAAGAPSKAAPVQIENPTIQAFAKHLGGEVVRPKKRTKEPS